jgi:hypothetical protein
MSNGKRKRKATRAASGDKAVRNAVLYIAKLKAWLKKEVAWQRRVRNDLRRLGIRSGNPTGTPPPPKPPYSP